MAETISNRQMFGKSEPVWFRLVRVRLCKLNPVEFAFDPIVTHHHSFYLEVFDRMKKHSSEIKPESWFVSAGRSSEPGAPLNVSPIPASNFIIGRGRACSASAGRAC